MSYTLYVIDEQLTNVFNLQKSEVICIRSLYSCVSSVTDITDMSGFSARIPCSVATKFCHSIKGDV